VKMSTTGVCFLTMKVIRITPGLAGEELLWSTNKESGSKRSEVTKAQHLLAITLLERLGLQYLRLEPATRGRYRYYGWTPAAYAANGAPPPPPKHGTVKMPNRK